MFKMLKCRTYSSQDNIRKEKIKLEDIHYFISRLNIKAE